MGLAVAMLGTVMRIELVLVGQVFVRRGLVGRVLVGLPVAVSLDWW